MQDTVLILGAGGFLGRYICHEYVRKGYRVIGIGRSAPPRHELERFIQGDLLEMNLKAVFREERPRWVVNAAGSASVDKSFSSPYEDWQQTVQMQAVVLDAIRQSAT